MSNQPRTLIEADQAIRNANADITYKLYEVLKDFHNTLHGQQNINIKNLCKQYLISYELVESAKRNRLSWINEDLPINE